MINIVERAKALQAIQQAKIAAAQKSAEAQATADITAAYGGNVATPGGIDQKTIMIAAAGLLLILLLNKKKR